MIIMIIIFQTHRGSSLSIFGHHSPPNHRLSRSKKDPQTVECPPLRRSCSTQSCWPHMELSIQNFDHWLRPLLPMRNLSTRQEKQPTSWCSCPLAKTLKFPLTDSFDGPVWPILGPGWQPCWPWPLLRELLEDM